MSIYHIEALESRRMFTTTSYLPTLGGFTLYMNATSAKGAFDIPDRSIIEFSKDNHSFTISDPADEPHPDPPTSGTYTYRLPLIPHGPCLLKATSTMDGVPLTVNVNIGFESQAGGGYEILLGPKDYEIGLFSVAAHKGTGTIRGHVFDDKNGNGKIEDGEAPLVGVRVWIDKNKDGKFQKTERSRFTSSTGTYRFADIPTGVYRVCMGILSGYHQTKPAHNPSFVALAPGMDSGGNNFGQTQIVASVALSQPQDRHKAAVDDLALLLQ